MTKKQLIGFIRDFLKDPDADSWQDDIIIFYIKNAIADIAHRTKWFKKVEVLPFINKEYGLIDLPKDHIKTIKLYFYNKELIPVTANNFIDRLDCCKGMPEYFIPPLTGRSELKVYPIPDDSILDNISIPDFGVFLDIEGTIVGDCLKNIEEVTSDASNYGTIDKGNKDIGVVGTIINSDNPITIWYAYIPYYEEDLPDDLHILDTLIVDLIIKYVTYSLLLQDKDQISINLYNIQKKEYEEGIRKLKHKSNLYFSGTMFKAGQRDIFKEVL